MDTHGTVPTRAAFDWENSRSADHHEPPGLSLTAGSFGDTSGAGSIAANDLNQAYSSGYGIMNLRAVARQNVGSWSISEFARLDNVFDRSYVGSVIVNQANSQFYESAPGRNWLAGGKATYKF